jgi:outer membrane biosynthesis protein TonB
VDPAKSDHGDAVNVKNIFLKTKTLNKYVEYEKDFRDRKIKRLKEEGNLTPALKKENDYVEKYQTEFDADVKKTAPKSKKEDQKPVTKTPPKEEPEKKEVPIKTPKKSTKKSTKKSSKKKTITKETSESEYTEEYFQNLYNEETGKTAVWRGEITKLYQKWVADKKEELGVK